ncbi:MAG: DUF4406 domain-containing protein [Nanoarchaeota archaeon]|nr:DUF4406 domain-containing protein [Nanoarchaeota archaeon]MBU1321443.1 DUF4406 domain-containing protein [Nanoarchaeota archaeon]MBU1596899.1 DUF4406 domain-containing protein [Nanoarchaeota archaeon]MBU2441564.1 DUF4406 domain-containing protein [Nanoarchaeota archaeon]
MTKRLRIYVAGPLTSNDLKVFKQNVKKAKEIGEQIFKKGHLPYVPHAHFYDWDIHMYKDYEFLLAHGIDILEKWADALFYIDPSKGADIEKKRAEELGLKIFTDISEIEEVK